MQIADIKEEQSRLDVEGQIVEKGESRTINLKAGGTMQVCDTVIRDVSGSIKLTLFGEIIGSVNTGDTVRVTNGYTRAFRGELSLNIGRFGKLAVL